MATKTATRQVEALVAKLEHDPDALELLVRLAELLASRRKTIRRR